MPNPLTIQEAIDTMVRDLTAAPTIGLEKSRARRIVEKAFTKIAQQEREAGREMLLRELAITHAWNYRDIKILQEKGYARAIEDVEKLCGDTFSGATLREHKELTEFYKGLESLPDGTRTQRTSGTYGSPTPITIEEAIDELITSLEYGLVGGNYTIDQEVWRNQLKEALTKIAQQEREAAEEKWGELVKVKNEELKIMDEAEETAHTEGYHKGIEDAIEIVEKITGYGEAHDMLIADLKSLKTSQTKT